MSDIQTVLIDGITGQTGSYLAEILLKNGYRVIGLKRRTSIINTNRIDHLYTNPNFIMRYFDLSDGGSFYRLLKEYNPSIVFHMGAQSHVKVSFEIPEYTVETIVLGTVRWLEAIRHHSLEIKFYNAGSSEQFGINPNFPYNEKSCFEPVSPYACAKCFSYNITKNYRMSYGLFACSGILFNHTSPRRGETFISRKITLGAARIKLGLQEYIELGNLDSSRDWGYAGDYAEAIYKIMCSDIPSDYVVSTGETHTVREFCQKVFEFIGLGDYQKYIKINSKYFRPQEVPYLLGDSSKIKKDLGWKSKVKFDDLIKMMCDSDLFYIKQEIAKAKEKWNLLKENY